MSLLRNKHICVLLHIAYLVFLDTVTGIEVCGSDSSDYSAEFQIRTRNGKDFLSLLPPLQNLFGSFFHESLFLRYILPEM